MKSTVGYLIQSCNADLATDIFLPSTNKYPIILIRTPYGRKSYYPQVKHWMTLGFGLVIQDVRGRYDSSGEWHPYIFERQDSKATMQWLTNQSWCESVIPIGASYEAATAWASAIEVPGAVAGLISKVPTVGLSRVKLDSSGILRLKEHISWWIANGGCRTIVPYLGDLLEKLYPDWPTFLPVSSMLNQLGLDKSLLKFEYEAIEFASTSNLQGNDVILPYELEKLDIPTLHIGGWKDSQIRETFRIYNHIADKKTLIIGDWGHDMGQSEKDTSCGAFQIKWLNQIRDQKFYSEGLVYDVGLSEWRNLAEKSSSNLTIELQNQDTNNNLRFNAAKVLSTRHNTTLSYRSAKLSAVTVLKGFPIVEFEVSKQSAELDWMCSLYVKANGKIIAQSSGAIAASNRVTSCSQKAIRLDPLCVTLDTRSQVELTISNSRFPELALWLGDGIDRYTHEQVDSSDYLTEIKHVTLRMENVHG